MTSIRDLYTVGSEFEEVQFNGTLDWFLRVTPLSIHWKYEPTYVISQLVFYFGGIATFIHSFVNGGRLRYLWLGILLHGIVVEMMTYYIPDINNFWHSQTSIIFLGLRLPLHILFLYPCFDYSANIAVSKLRLPSWAEPFAVGLVATLIDIPYDIVSINFLHWTWHDTDPNVEERHYWVPWNSYYFHTTFAAGFSFWFHFIRRKLCQTEGKWVPDKRKTRELLCTIIPAILGTPTGILLFLPIYHPLHDIFKIHSEVTYFILFSLCLCLIWTGVYTPKSEEKPKAKTHWTTWLLVAHLVFHYVSFLIMPIFFNPEDEIAMGLKEPIGPCDIKAPVHTAFGMTLEKRKFLCATDYDEKYFDWHCLPGGKPPSNGSYWYTACGVPFPNRAEIIAVISIITIVAGFVFVNLHFRADGDGVFSAGKKNEQKSKKLKQR